MSLKDELYQAVTSLHRPQDLAEHPHAQSAIQALACLLGIPISTLQTQTTHLPPNQTIGPHELTELLTHHHPELQSSSRALTLGKLKHGLAHIQYGTPANTGWIAITRRQGHILIWDPNWPLSWLPKITWEHGVAARVSRHLPITILHTLQISAPSLRSTPPASDLSDSSDLSDLSDLSELSEPALA